ncbi:alpha/beta hydrolase fold domain-containing protein [Kineococcus gynurae]|uniref:Alpha/beta hydrolase fold domain-containing protein n=1 Tax=Kineococcus gynurae TaxID=452979 RepID=A0ABV5LU86_9ACTN
MSRPSAGAPRVLPADRGRTNVFVHLGVVYRRVDGLDLHLQVIQPSGDAAMLGWEAAFSGRYPCLAFVQGSGWRRQDLGAGLAFLCRLAERGHVVAVVEHRSSAVAPHPAQVHDARAAVRWLRAHAEDYGIDPDRVAVSGDSSGGHVALLLHATDGAPALDEDPDGAALRLTHTVAFYPPTDLTRMDHEDAVRELLGGVGPGEDPAAARAASPATHLDRRPRGPVLLVHGSADEVVPPEHSTGYADVLRAAGQHCEVVMVEGAGHGIWPSLFTPELIDVVDDFLRR